MSKSDHGKPAREGWNREYERAWLKAHGKRCPDCKGTGVYSSEDGLGGDICTNSICPNCDGIGYMEKKK